MRWLFLTVCDRIISWTRPRCNRHLDTFTNFELGRIILATNSSCLKLIPNTSFLVKALSHCVAKRTFRMFSFLSFLHLSSLHGQIYCITVCSHRLLCRQLSKLLFPAKNFQGYSPSSRIFERMGLFLSDRFNFLKLTHILIMVLIWHFDQYEAHKKLCARDMECLEVWSS